MPPSHIFVTAPPGRRTPLHSWNGTEPGGGVQYVEPGKATRVRFVNPDGASTCQTLRRAIARGDLQLCNMNGALVDSFAAADASVEGEAPAPRAKKGGAP